MVSNASRLVPDRPVQSKFVPTLQFVSFDPTLQFVPFEICPRPARVVARTHTLIRAIRNLLPQAPQELLVAVKNLDTQQRQQIEAKQSHAERKLKDVVKLIAEPETAEELGAEIARSAAGMVRGSTALKTYALIVFDGKLLCESGTQTKYRPVPTRQPQVNKLLSAVLAARADSGQMADGDLIIASDGGKGKDFEDKIEKVLSAVQHTTTKHIISYTCESAEKRMERDHGGMLELMETVHIVGKTPPTLSSSGPGRISQVSPRGANGWDQQTTQIGQTHLQLGTSLSKPRRHCMAHRTDPGREINAQ